MARSHADGAGFGGLRAWHGEQSRAFEEISYQLLKDQAPARSRVIRTGNPDGGVEWYAELDDGSEMGWQAKYISGIDTLLGAMTESVRRVVMERPRLTHLTFVISTNLSAGKAGFNGKARKSQREKYDDKVATWKANIPGAAHLTFDRHCCIW
jgi:hypothetical protein